MKNLLAVFSLAMLFGAPSIASAQTRTPTPKATPTPAPVATPAPIVAAPAPAPADDAPAMPVARFEAGPGEPNEKTIGVGAGLAVNGTTSVFTPNTVSVRFRRANGMTIEPFLNATFDQNFEHTHLVIGDNRPHVASRDYTATLAVGAQLRKPIARKGPVEWHFLASPLVAVTDSVVNPVGADDRVSNTATTWALGWGLGVEYFPPKFEQHWSLSMDATNPLFAFSYETMYDQSTNVRTNTTGYTLGAVFNPTVRGMLHLYY